MQASLSLTNVLFVPRPGREKTKNGKDCTFCHFPHDKRKPSRQEKRERRAAWLAQRGEGEACDYSR